MLRLVRKGPLEISEAAPAIEAGRPAAPVLAPAVDVVKGFYVLLDGFAPDARSRNVIMNSIAPI